MRKTSAIITAVLLLPLLLCCTHGYEKQQQSLMEASKQDLATAVQERDRLLVLVKEVYDDMEQIQQLENVMATGSGDFSHKRLLTDINALKDTLQQRRRQLHDLEEALGRSAVSNDRLQETIHTLRTQIDSQMEEIESLRRQLTAAGRHIGVLNNRVDSLNAAVSTVKGERNAALETSQRLGRSSQRYEQQSQQLENELNTCYYVAATKKELKAHRIIDSGFLRKTRLMKGDFDKGSFAVQDKRTLAVLPLPGRKAKILTNHPEGSYELTEENGRKTLRITDPRRFWSLGNYLVIQTD